MSRNSAICRGCREWFDNTDDYRSVISKGICIECSGKGLTECPGCRIFKPPEDFDNDICSECIEQIMEETDEREV